MFRKSKEKTDVQKAKDAREQKRLALFLHPKPPTPPLAKRPPRTSASGNQALNKEGEALRSKNYESSSESDSTTDSSSSGSDTSSSSSSDENGSDARDAKDINAPVSAGYPPAAAATVPGCPTDNVCPAAAWSQATGQPGNCVSAGTTRPLKGIRKEEKGKEQKRKPSVSFVEHKQKKALSGARRSKSSV
ncbi:PHD finger protein rhinoceros-like isoform X4 [Ornithodoros turicata]|uniref:PHD finger protein rhinoceros-like isoform X4 n=1 Tax=Ornithodoros turicata TaxID=34597 RepID=UPI0031390B16